MDPMDSLEGAIMQYNRTFKMKAKRNNIYDFSSFDKASLSRKTLILASILAKSTKSELVRVSVWM